MARVGLNFVEVAAAFEKLLSQGEQPTPEKILEFLGRGTLPVIQKHLQHIMDQSRLDLITQEERTPAAVNPEPIVHVAPSVQTEPTVTIEAPTPAATSEKPASSESAAPGKRVFKRDRFANRNNNNNGSHQTKPMEFEEIAVEAPLEQLSEETLVTKVRRLESILMKEQLRRESAEKIMVDTKDYAESIKEQVGQRINDLRENMALVVEQLKTQLREQKQNFDQDLKYYQEQLSKANEKIATLIK